MDYLSATSWICVHAWEFLNVGPPLYYLEVFYWLLTMQHWDLNFVNHFRFLDFRHFQSVSNAEVLHAVHPSELRPFFWRPSVKDHRIFASMRAVSSSRTIETSHSHYFPVPSRQMSYRHYLLYRPPFASSSDVRIVRCFHSGLIVNHSFLLLN